MAREQQELLADIRFRVDDEDADRYTDARIRHWINEIQTDICRRTECIVATDTVTAVPGTSTYAAPLDTIRIHLLRYEDSSGYAYGMLEFIDNHNFNLHGAVYTSYAPEVYTQLGIPGAMQFKVHPTPDDAGEFEVTYYKQPAVLATNTDDEDVEVDMPVGWEDLITDGVEYKLLRADRDPRWQEAKALYDENIGMLLEIAVRYNDQAGQWGAEYSAGSSYGSGWGHF